MTRPKIKELPDHILRNCSSHMLRKPDAVEELNVCFQSATFSKECNYNVMQSVTSIVTIPRHDSVGCIRVLQIIVSSLGIGYSTQLINRNYFRN